MAQDMTEKELLKMELDQLKKEVKNERQMVSSSLYLRCDLLTQG